MDATLRCNKPNGACRAPLVERAVVTTCWSDASILLLLRSLMIAVTSSACDAPMTLASPELQLASDPVQHAINICPTMTTLLRLCSSPPRTTNQACSVVLTLLQSWSVPAEHWRSGPIRLRKRCNNVSFLPVRTLTCSSAYQEYLGKIMTDKYTHLSRGMDKVINDANTEIQTLQDRVMSEIRTWFQASG